MSECYNVDLGYFVICDTCLNYVEMAHSKAEFRNLTLCNMKLSEALTIKKHEAKIREYERCTSNTNL